ncbi:MAG: T9SS type A sorting domain-containing protein, partial [Psychroflexus halocasei]
ENVTITEGDGTAMFAAGTNYTLTDGSNSTILRTQFQNADFIGEVIPSTQLNNVVGIVSEFGGDGQLFPRSLDDFNATLGNTSFDATEFSVYPNPTQGTYVNINTSNSDDFTVEVYDILGKAVISQEMNSNESLNISALKSGVYLVKITQESNSITKKLIVR